MALTQSQSALFEKARTVGGGDFGVSLDEKACAFILGIIVSDLNVLKQFPEFAGQPHDYFRLSPESCIVETSVSSLTLFERLLSIHPDADTYFYCLAALHKSRLKYSRILEFQSIPTLDQVGPRSLLQYGHMKAGDLAGFLLWRKWIFDIDNRAGQETGYLFEPILAHAIGGTPVSSKKSPIRRSIDKSRGRQVDCIRQKHAYEFKLRVTIAASGQGRWSEELKFPVDCRRSGYTPVLVVLDPTANPKLEELGNAFRREGGEVYVGDVAWAHLEAAAGTTIAIFIEKYVRNPLTEVVQGADPDLPEISLKMSKTSLRVCIGESAYTFTRSANQDLEKEDPIADDIDEEETP